MCAGAHPGGCAQGLAPAMHAGEAGRELAAELAQAYLGTAYTAWSATGQMFEKFNALGKQPCCAADARCCV